MLSPRLPVFYCSDCVQLCAMLGYAHNLTVARSTPVDAMKPAQKVAG